MKTFLVVSLFGALAVLAPTPALTQPTPTATASPQTDTSPKKEKTKRQKKSETAESGSPNATTKQRAIPFRGKISAADAKAKTFTLAGKEHSRIIKITEKTIMTKGGNPAVFEDLKENEVARGSYWKQADGTLEARNLKIGPKTEAEKAAKKARKARRKAAEPSPTPPPKP